MEVFDGFLSTVLSLLLSRLLSANDGECCLGVKVGVKILFGS